MVFRQIAPDFFVAHLIFNLWLSIEFQVWSHQAGTEWLLSLYLGSSINVAPDYNNIVTVVSINIARSYIYHNSYHTIS